MTPEGRTLDEESLRALAAISGSAIQRAFDQVADDPYPGLSGPDWQKVRAKLWEVLAERQLNVVDIIVRREGTAGDEDRGEIVITYRARPKKTKGGAPRLAERFPEQCREVARRRAEGQSRRRVWHEYLQEHCIAERYADANLPYDHALHGKLVREYEAAGRALL